MKGIEEFGVLCSTCRGASHTFRNHAWTQFIVHCSVRHKTERRVRHPLTSVSFFPCDSNRIYENRSSWRANWEARPTTCSPNLDQSICGRLTEAQTLANSFQPSFAAARVLLRFKTIQPTRDSPTSISYTNGTPHTAHSRFHFTTATNVV